MANEYLHINYQPGGGWMLTIMNRLNHTSSATLRQRMNAWGSSPLSKMGLALATKLAMLSQVVQRVDDRLQRLTEQLSDRSMINECVRRGAAYPIADKSLPYEMLVDIDSFLFESRSAYEIVGHFLCQFFETVLKCSVNEVELQRILDDQGLDTRWIEELRENRILFFHKTAPWIAIYIVSKEPFRFELVILKTNVKDFTNPGDYIHFEQLRAIYRGFISSLEMLHQWVIQKIEDFEIQETR